MDNVGEDENLENELESQDILEDMPTIMIRKATVFQSLEKEPVDADELISDFLSPANSIMSLASFNSAGDYFEDFGSYSNSADSLQGLFGNSSTDNFSDNFSLQQPPSPYNQNPATSPFSPAMTSPLHQTIGSPYNNPLASPFARAVLSPQTQFMNPAFNQGLHASNLHIQTSPYNHPITESSSLTPLMDSLLAIDPNQMHSYESKLDSAHHNAYESAASSTIHDLSAFRDSAMKAASQDIEQILNDQSGSATTHSATTQSPITRDPKDGYVELGSVSLQTRVINGDELFKCPNSFCHKWYKKLYHLQRHHAECVKPDTSRGTRRMLTPTDGPSNTTCPICKHRFARKDALTRHWKGKNNPCIIQIRIQEMEKNKAKS